MTLPANQAGHQGWAPLRAITAVIALYAFVLHATLSGLVPLPVSSAHGILCLGQSDDAGPGAPDPAHAHHQPCCTVAGPMLQAALPEVVARTIIWPVRTASRVAWRRESLVSARGPPGAIPHPRGPPVV
ncbi:hypothetical protein ACLBWX_04475 [Methylobacterium sp. M6A4_1b]